MTGPADPWRTGDAAADLLAEGFAVAGALAALEDEPAKLTQAIDTLSGDDLRAALFAVTFERWIEEAVRRRRPLQRLARAVTRVLRGRR